MVLVDPSIPDQLVVMERVAPKVAAMGNAATGALVKRLQDCAAELRAGTLKRGTPRFQRCTAAPDRGPVWSGLTVTLARLNANPARLLTQASSQKEFPDDSREVINANRHYGNLPLTAGRDADTAIPLPPLGAPGIRTPSDRAELRKEIVRFFKDAWGPAHDAYAALSTRGRNRLVPDSGHSIPIEKPAAVISAVSEVLDEIRPSSSTSPPAPPVN